MSSHLAEAKEIEKIHQEVFDEYKYYKNPKVELIAICVSTGVYFPQDNVSLPYNNESDAKYNAFRDKYRALQAEDWGNIVYCFGINYDYRLKKRC